MAREKCPICGEMAYEVIHNSCDIGDHHIQRWIEEGCHACGWTPYDYEPASSEPEDDDTPF